jgi:hypothetical protein
VNSVPGTTSCTIRKGELEECRRMVGELIEKVIDLGSEDDSCRAETAMEALQLLRYMGNHLDEGLKPEPESEAAQ